MLCQSHHPALHGCGATELTLFSLFKHLIICSRTCLKYNPYTSGWKNLITNPMFGTMTYSVNSRYTCEPTRNLPKMRNGVNSRGMDTLPKMTTNSVMIGFLFRLMVHSFFLKTERFVDWLLTPANLVSLSISL